jgi:hypothetical protein
VTNRRARALPTGSWEKAAIGKAINIAGTAMEKRGDPNLLDIDS